MLNIYQNYVTDADGNAISGASVECRQPGTTTKVDIYSDEAGNSQYSNNTTSTDSAGYFYFYVKGGKYDVYADDGSGHTVDFENVQLGTAQKEDLAEDGGTILKKDRDETIAGSYKFSGSSSARGAGGDVSVAFDYHLGFTGASTPNPFIRTSQVSKFGIYDGNYHTTFHTNGGIEVRSPSGGDKGAGTVNGKLYDEGNEVARQPTGSSDPGLSPGSWRTPNSDRATHVLVEVRVNGGGGDQATMDVDVDESGGTSPTYTVTVAQVNDSENSNTTRTSTASFIVPPGGSYQVKKTSDPTGFNSLYAVRESTF